MLGVYYVIRHRATGEIMPALDRNRGYSHWNPPKMPDDKKILGVPRILKSIKQANQVISQWNAMPNAQFGGYTNHLGEDDYDIRIKPDGRKKEDLEVIEVLIEERK